MGSERAQPVAEGERIVALDVLRGFALLGILIMNVQAFAMPPAAYSNPTAFGDLSGINGAVWVGSHVFGDLKFMAIFSMLFGAGVCLFAERARARTGRSAGPHYRRSLALLAVGIAHGYLLFYGDILVTYGLCALWVYWMRNRRPRTLVITAIVLLSIPTLLSLMFGASVPHMPAEVRQQLAEGWAPSAEVHTALIEGMRGSFAEQLAARAPITLELQTVVLLVFFLWRASGMMLLGMALYKTGGLTAAREASWYRRLVLIGLPPGLALSIFGVTQNFAHGWAFEYSMFYGNIANYWGSIGTALAYVALVMLAVEQGRMPALQARLAAAGRMAFTNYLAQSLICTVVFNTMGLFGATPRWQQLLVVLAVWALQLWYSPVWLGRFRFGPLEWLWRIATYGRVPPAPQRSPTAP